MSVDKHAGRRRLTRTVDRGSGEASVTIFARIAQAIYYVIRIFHEF
jgi:hypothetical protein